MTTFEKIYTEYYPKIVYYFSTRIRKDYEAEDLAQIVFIKVYRFLDTFDISKNFSSWIYTIAKNTLVDYFRSDCMVSYEEDMEPLLPSEDPQAVLFANKQRDAVNDAISKLNEKEKQIIMWHYYDGLSLLKISSTKSIPYGQVKRAHVKALQSLGKYFKVENVNYGSV